MGSGPDRGRSPVEWGDFPSVRSSVRSPLWAIQPGLKPSQPGLRPSQPSLKPEAGWLAGWLGLRAGWLGSGLAGWASGLAGWASGLAGWASGLAGWPRGGTDGQTYERTDGKSPHSIGLRPLLGPLPKKQIKLRESFENGPIMIIFVSNYKKKYL